MILQEMMRRLLKDHFIEDIMITTDDSDFGFLLNILNSNGFPPTELAKKP